MFAAAFHSFVATARIRRDTQLLKDPVVSGTPPTEGREEQARGGLHHQEQAGAPHDTCRYGREANGRRVSLCPLQRKRCVGLF